MITIPKPEYTIKIGILKGEIVSIRWSNKFAYKYVDDKKCIKDVKKYLKKAYKMVKER
jgi:hypothetical protein